MSLPFGTKEVREISDEINKEDESHIDAVFETMAPYIEEIVDKLAIKYNLTEEQQEELTDRLGWRFELFDNA